MTQHLLKSHEVAAILGVSVGTLRNWRVEGRGPRAVVLGGRLRYRRQEVDEWIEGQLEPRVGA